MKCHYCPRACQLKEGEPGACLSRSLKSGENQPLLEGMVSSLGFDPIEKKPLAYFRPQSQILSVGFFGCNMKCPFCQNHEISQHYDEEGYILSPNELLGLAKKYKDEGNIGLAYTYNEPLLQAEFIAKTAALIHEEGMVNVLVTNGCFNVLAVEKTLRLMDAMNIDLKGFSNEVYQYLGGDLNTVKDFIRFAYSICHIELTTLVVTGLNDSLEMLEEEAKWIASIDKRIPLHLTRYFPAYRYQKKETDIGLLFRMKEIASRYLERVLIGNI